MCTEVLLVKARTMYVIRTHRTIDVRIYIRTIIYRTPCTSNVRTRTLCDRTFTYDWGTISFSVTVNIVLGYRFGCSTGKSTKDVRHSYAPYD